MGKVSGAAPQVEIPLDGTQPEANLVQDDLPLDLREAGIDELAPEEPLAQEPLSFKEAMSESANRLQHIALHPEQAQEYFENKFHDHSSTWYGDDREALQDYIRYRYAELHHSSDDPTQIPASDFPLIDVQGGISIDGDLLTFHAPGLSGEVRLNLTDLQAGDRISSEVVQDTRIIYPNQEIEYEQPLIVLHTARGFSLRAHSAHIERIPATSGDMFIVTNTSSYSTNAPEYLVQGHAGNALEGELTIRFREQSGGAERFELRDSETEAYIEANDESIFLVLENEGSATLQQQNKADLAVTLEAAYAAFRHDTPQGGLGVTGVQAAAGTGVQHALVMADADITAGMVGVTIGELERDEMSGDLVKLPYQVDFSDYNVVLSRNSSSFAVLNDPGELGPELDFSRSVTQESPSLHLEQVRGLRAAYHDGHFAVFEPTSENAGNAAELGRISLPGTQPAIYIRQDASGEVSLWDQQEAASDLQQAGFEFQTVHEGKLLTAVRERIDQRIPQIVEADKVIREIVPERMNLDFRNGVYEIDGLLGLNIRVNPDEINVYGDDLEGPLVEEALQTIINLVAEMDRVRQVADRNRDPELDDRDSVDDLQDMGYTPQQAALFRDDVGQAILNYVRNVPGIARKNAREGKFHVEDARIASLDFHFDRANEPGEVQAFSLSIQLENVLVDGALPLGVVGEVAAGVVGAPGLIGDLTGVIDEATEDNGFLNFILKPITLPGEVIGAVFDGGETVVNVAIGEVKADFSLQMDGTQLADGSWSIGEIERKLALRP